MPRPIGCTIHHNLFPARHLPLLSRCWDWVCLAHLLCARPPILSPRYPRTRRFGFVARSGAPRRCLDCGMRIRNADSTQTCNGTPFAPRRAGGQLYKQTQFQQRERRGKCLAGKSLWLIVHPIGLGKTKPIPPGGTRQAGLPAELSLGHDMSNKPNPCHYADPEIGVPGRANRAKRSQFLNCGLRISDCGLGTALRRDGPLCETNPIVARQAEPMDIEQAIASGARQPAAVCRPDVRVRPQDNPVAWAAVVE